MSPLAEPFLVLALALAVDAAIGEPRRPTHPVVWMGRLVGLLERLLNAPGRPAAARRRGGVLALVLLLAAAAGSGALVAWLARLLPFGGLLDVLFLAWLLAGRSLHQHVAAVATALRRDGLAAGRAVVGRIVGRDTSQLEASGVARAAIESLAENFSDGVVAPAFWYLVGGLPGLFAYKALNTADSMVGHRSARHAAFGWASARLDDLANLPASRISAGLIALAAAFLPGGRPRAALATARRDASKHKSPNAGWPEAAMAGALGLRLNGPKRYAGRWRRDAWMGDGRADIDAREIDRALALYRRTLVLLALLALAAGIAGLPER